VLFLAADGPFAKRDIKCFVCSFQPICDLPHILLVPRLNVESLDAFVLLLLAGFVAHAADDGWNGHFSILVDGVLSALAPPNRHTMDRHQQFPLPCSHTPTIIITITAPSGRLTILHRHRPGILLLLGLLEPPGRVLWQ